MTLAFSTADLVHRYTAGETVTELAQRYECSKGTILYRLKQSGAWSRKRAGVNTRTMLTTFKPILLVLLAQVEGALKTVRAEFLLEGVHSIKRKKYLERISRLEDQIHVLKMLTSKS